jgi:regulator of cell morphogenesis and NO signaling
MSELITKSLAQIVNSNHRAANVFEKYHLDFCCKGKRTLEQACSESQIQVTDVIAELEKNCNSSSSAIPANYDRFSLVQLSEYIVNTHHAYVKKESPAILGYLLKVAAKHGDRHPEMIKVLQLFTAVKEEMEHHMQKEELILFPRIKDIEKQLAEGKEMVINSSYLLAPVTMMEKEHDHAGTLLAEIRQLTNDYTPLPMPAPLTS